jgi:hypothetical protein
MLRIDQAGKGLRIALLAHMPIGSPGKLSPRALGDNYIRALGGKR